MNDGRKIVWVLGAGFSRSLGAPLLPQLFSDTSLDKARATFDKKDYPLLYEPIVDQAHMLYQWGRNFLGTSSVPPKLPLGRLVWDDAEQFLDYLDVAKFHPGGPADTFLNSTILPHFGLSPADVMRAARRLLAAECSAFLASADLNAEKWQPYIRWFEHLVGNEDTIVTFNYDRVVEILQKHTGKGMQNVLPDTVIDSHNPETLLLKMHGSVDWKREADPQGKVTVTRDQQENYAVLFDDSMLGTPGPSKRSAAGDLKVIWDHALGALKTADAVVFVGYRFPPTDAAARSSILGALRKNKTKWVHAHTVLGMNTQDEHSARLRSLLAYGFGSDRPARANSVSGRTWYNLTPQPLLAEDFFTVCERSDILIAPSAQP